MGEVYKARDTRLDRLVAVKVLPETLAADPQFRARFELEARAISQLAHPNICTLHDVGEDHGTSFLVMEYLEGETLADRLATGPLPLADALPIAMQIAGALDRAHRAGHRPSRPEAGQRLPDEDAAPSCSISAWPRALRPSSAARCRCCRQPRPRPSLHKAAILGTFQYMAPEQIEGQEADARTDIFAFGAVLYEMLTGKRAFDGKSQATLIGSIMASQPAPLSAVSPTTPPALDRLVRTCLAKDPNDRYQSAHDVLLALQSVGDLSTASPAPLPRLVRSRRWPWLAAGAAAAVAAAAASLITSTMQRREAAQPMRFALSAASTEIFSAGPERHEPGHLARRPVDRLPRAHRRDLLDLRPSDRSAERAPAERVRAGAGHVLFAR